jgi:hypothetical protein
VKFSSKNLKLLFGLPRFCLNSCQSMLFLNFTIFSASCGPLAKPSHFQLQTSSEEVPTDDISGLKEMAVISETEVFNIKLESIKNNPDIAYRVFERVSTIANKPDFSTKTLKIKFPSLSRNQFDFLKQHYGKGTSRVQFEEGETYSLTDFFQPPIQALENKFHDRTSETHPWTNCWSTGYEVATFDSRVFSFYVASDRDLEEVLRQSKFAKILSETESPQPGDLGTSLLRGDIVHAWIYLDQGITFDKESFGPSSFRVMYDDEMASKKFKKIYYRVNREFAPKGVTTFRSYPDRSKLNFKSYPYVFDRLGRAHLTFPRFSGDRVKQSPTHVHTPLDSCCQEKNESAHDCTIHGSTQKCSGLPPP